MQRRFRLRRRQDFARLRRDGRVYHHRLMRLSLLSNDLAHNRYGVIVTKAIGGAVERNRTRRLVREAVRLLHPQLKPGFDVVIIARPGLGGQPFREVWRIVKDMCRQAGILES